MPDSSFSALSSHGTRYFPSFGRLNGPSAWCPMTNRDQYLQIHVPDARVICAVAVQGFENMNEYVTSFSVTYSVDGNKWLAFTDDKGEKEKVLMITLEKYKREMRTKLALLH